MKNKSMEFTVIKKLAARLDQAFLDLLFPPRCPVCDRVVLPGTGICAACRASGLPEMRQAAFGRAEGILYGLYEKPAYFYAEQGVVGL